MPTSLIVYFSLGGTTARVAESIAMGLGTAGFQVDLCNLRDAQPPGLGGDDLLGMGSPAYYYRPPFNVTDHIDCLPELDGLPAFVFALHGTYLGDTGNAMRQALARKGARDVGYFRCRGADYYLGYLREGYLFSPGHPTPKELARAEEFGRRVAAVVGGQEYTPPSDDPPPAIMYRLERFLASRRLASQVYSRLFRVRRQACTACGLCTKSCPTRNIIEDDDARPVWGRNCLLCLNCEMVCPEDAVTSPASWPLLRLFMIYNVRRASQDPRLDHVRVRQSRGRTEPA